MLCLHCKFGTVSSNLICLCPVNEYLGKFEERMQPKICHLNRTRLVFSSRFVSRSKVVLKQAYHPSDLWSSHKQWIQMDTVVSRCFHLHLNYPWKFCGLVPSANWVGLWVPKCPTTILWQGTSRPTMRIRISCLPILDALKVGHKAGQRSGDTLHIFEYWTIEHHNCQYSHLSCENTSTEFPVEVLAKKVFGMHKLRLFYFMGLMLCFVVRAPGSNKVRDARNSSKTWQVSSAAISLWKRDPWPPQVVRTPQLEFLEPTCPNGKLYYSNLFCLKVMWLPQLDPINSLTTKSFLGKYFDVLCGF